MEHQSDKGLGESVESPISVAEKKEAKKEAVRNETNLIVRNLSKGVSDADLQAHFGGIGPIRHCFVVKDAVSGKSKRYAFVCFALAEHAQIARNSLHHSTLSGRRIIIDFAYFRSRIRADDVETPKRLKVGNSRNAENVEEPAKPYHTERKRNASQILARGDAGARDENAKSILAQGSVPIRTVVLRRKDGAELTEMSAKSAFDSLPDAKESIENVVLASNGLEARIIFRKWSIAGKAAVAAHGDIFDACIDALRTGERTTVIVRNLPFRMSRKALRDPFSRVVAIRTVRLGPPPPSRRPSKSTNPTDAADDEVLDCGGYAFIELFTVSDAKHAVAQMNGIEIGGRVVAVDMALTKSKYDHAQKILSSGLGASTSNGNESGEKESDNSSVPDEDLGNHDVEDENENKEVEVSEHLGQENDTRERKDPLSSSEELARTVFVRNLLFETKPHVLWQEMERQFGKVEQAVLVRDRVTQMPKGTAFVRFASVDAAQAAERAANGTLGAPVKEELNKRSLVRRDSRGVWVDGRRIFLSMATDRAQAKIAQDARTQEKDPRNLHLVSVGSIERGSPEGMRLSAQDWAKRDMAEKNKRIKLKNNPNTYVSDVRLCVRNLPRGIDERVLKEMFLNAAAKPANDQFDRSMDKLKDEKRHFGKRKEQVRITHCTIVRDEERNDRSKGFGFVTFEKHDDAMRALKSVNNNPQALESLVIEQGNRRLVGDHGVAEHLRRTWGANRRLIVEFSVEDARYVRVLDRIKEKGKQLREEHRSKKECLPVSGDATFSGNKKRAGADSGLESDKLSIEQDAHDGDEKDVPNGKKSRQRKRRKVSGAKDVGQKTENATGDVGGEVYGSDLNGAGNAVENGKGQRGRRVKRKRNADDSKNNVAIEGSMAVDDQKVKSRPFKKRHRKSAELSTRIG